MELKLWLYSHVRRQMIIFFCSAGNFIMLVCWGSTSLVRFVVLTWWRSTSRPLKSWNIVITLKVKTTFREKCIQIIFVLQFWFVFNENNSFVFTTKKLGKKISLPKQRFITKILTFFEKKVKDTYLRLPDVPFLSYEWDRLLDLE